MKTQLVVVGGGPGGYAAAFLAADLGMETTIVDMQPRLGGVCLLRGCIPSKALLHVAKIIGETGHLAEWGVAYQQPEIDLDTMRKRKDRVVRTLTDGLAQLAKKRKVRVLQARATFENSTTLRLHAVGDSQPEEELIEFEHCILATGSSPLRIPALEVDSDRMMDSTVALDLPEIPESLLVVGGGYIGLEMGTVYAALGAKVSVVELTDGLLPGADRNLVKPLHKRLEKEFEAIYLNTKVTGMASKRNAIEVSFEGEAAEKKRYSRVLMSVGRRPNSANLGLENTKVEIDDQGHVVVDRQQRTADPHILAIGDVAGQPMLAHKAAHEGKVAVEALAGEPAEFAPRAIPAVVFTDPEIAWAGLTENEAKNQDKKVDTAMFPWAASGRAQAIGQTDGLTKWLVDPDSQRVLGCGVVGTGAGDLISEAVLAIEMGAHLRDVAESIHPHPTLSETLAVAAEVPLGLATDVYRPPRRKK